MNKHAHFSNPNNSLIRTPPGTELFGGSTVLVSRQSRDILILTQLQLKSGTDFFLWISKIFRRVWFIVVSTKLTRRRSQGLLVEIYYSCLNAVRRLAFCRNFHNSKIFIVQKFHVIIYFLSLGPQQKFLNSENFPNYGTKSKRLPFYTSIIHFTLTCTLNRQAIMT